MENKTEAANQQIHQAMWHINAALRCSLKMHTALSTFQKTKSFMTLHGHQSFAVQL